LSNPNISYEMNERVIDLRFLIKVLKKRFMLITLVTLLAVIASGTYCYYMLKPFYRARTLLLVTQATETVNKSQITAQKDDLNSILNSAHRTPVLTMNTYVGMIKSEILMQRVIKKLHLDEMGYTPRSLANQINATVAKDSYLIEVTVNSSDPGLAVRIANTLNQEFMAMMTEKNQELMDHSVEFLQEQMGVIKNELANIKEPAEQNRLNNVITLLSEGITKTQIARNVDLGNLVLVSPAMAPYPVMPKKLHIMTVAFILGLMASVGMAFLLESMGNDTKTSVVSSQ